MAVSSSGGTARENVTATGAVNGAVSGVASNNLGKRACFFFGQC